MTRDETLKRLKGRALYADAVEALARVVSNAHPARVALLKSQADFEATIPKCENCNEAHPIIERAEPLPGFPKTLKNQ